VIGVAVFVASFRILYSWGCDWVTSLIASILPFGVMTLVFWLLFKDKPASWGLDVCSLFLWRFWAWLYFQGGLDWPPELWVKGKKPMHPGVKE